MWSPRTAVLLTLLAGLTALVGWAALGPVGAALVMVVSVLTSTAAYRGRAYTVLRRMGGRPIPWYEAPDLYSLVTALAQRAGLPTPQLYLMPGHMANAVTVASDTYSAIGVTEPLLRYLPPEEVAAVIAHEVSHVRHKDLHLATVGAGLAGAAAILAEIARWDVIFAWLVGVPIRPDELAAALLVAAGVPSLALALRMAISREREFLADAGGAQFVGSPELMAQALWRLEQINRGTWWQRLLGLSAPSEPTGLARWFLSHPPTSERIARLQAMQRRSWRSSGRRRFGGRKKWPCPPWHPSRKDFRGSTFVIRW